MNVNGSAGYNLYGFNRINNVQLEYFNTYAASASLIRIVGRHSLKLGAELRKMEDINAAAGNSGSFNYNGNFSGDEWLDFLLGFTSGGSINVQSGVYAYNYYQGYYVTDTWQPTRQLTVNLGLRWELPGGVYSKHDLNNVLLPNTTDPNYNTMGTLALVKSSLSSSGSSLDVKHNLFAPRVGLAYRINDSNVVRAGYGLSYLPVDAATGSFPENSPLISVNSNCGPANGATIPIASAMMYNCFSSSSPIIQPPGRVSNILLALGLYNNVNGRISAPVPHQKFPYAQQWNLSVSHQFKGNLMFDLGYMGAAEIHAPASGSQLNQISDGIYDSTGHVRSGTYAGMLLTATGSCGNDQNNHVKTVGQCLRPYPYFGGVSDSLAYTAQTNYHALQLKGEKRFNNGGTLMGNFAWAKMIGNTDSGHGMLESGTQGPNSQGGGAGGIQDYNNLGRTGGERATTSYDVPYRAVFSYVLNLPFGQGQRWGHDASGIVGHVISGWGVNGITTFQHGFHVPVKDRTVNNGPSKNNDLSTYGIGSLRPNYTAGCAKTIGGAVNSRVAEWFNTSCFTQPADYTFGTEPRVDTRIFAEGIANFDFSAMKTTKVTERTTVQFRAELFNLFNRKQFAQPDSSLGSNTFGQILGDNNQPRLVQFSLRVNF